MPDESIQTTTAKKTFLDFINGSKMKEQLANALPKHLTPDRFIRVLLTATMKQPKLLECTQESMLKGVMDCAGCGLEIDGRRAHLVPYWNSKKRVLEAQLILDYKGIVELAMRSGLVSTVHADNVCEHDTFRVNKGVIEEHCIDYRLPRGAHYATYCIIRMKDGGEKAEVMSKEEIDAVRSRSKASDNGPWMTDYGEMAKKTAARRALKWVALSPEIRELVESDDNMMNVTGTAGFDVPAPEIKRPIFERPEPKSIEAERPSLQPEPAPTTEADMETPQSAPEPVAQKAPVAAPAPATTDRQPARDDSPMILEALEGYALDLDLSEKALIPIAVESKWDVPPKAKALRELHPQTIANLHAWAGRELRKRQTP